jgi:hypothetical protein
MRLKKHFKMHVNMNAVVEVDYPTTAVNYAGKS